MHQFPVTWLVPLLVFIIVTTGGLVGVFIAAKDERQKKEYQLSLQVASILEIIAAGVNNEIKPWTAISQALANTVRMTTFFEIIPEAFSYAWTQVRQDTFLWSAIAFNGRVLLVQPPNTSIASSLMSLDLLDPKPPFTSELRSATLYTVQSRKMIVTGLAIDNNGGSGGLAMVVWPVWAPVTSKDDAWGWSASSIAKDCQPTGNVMCYADSARWWGNLVFMVNWTAVSYRQDGPLTAIRADKTLGYLFSIEPGVAPDTDPEPPIVVDQRGTCVSSQVVAKVYLSRETRLALMMCLTSAPRVRWEAPLAVLCIVIGVITAVLLGALLMTRARYHMLLQALLPAPVIDQLQEQMATEGGVLAPDRPKGALVDHLISLLRELLDGRTPVTADVAWIMLELRHAQNLYVPSDLKSHVQRAVGAHPEVAAALVAALTDGPDLGLSPDSLYLQPKDAGRAEPNGKTLASPAAGADFASVQDALMHILSAKPNPRKGALLDPTTTEAGTVTSESSTTRTGIDMEHDHWVLRTHTAAGYSEQSTRLSQIVTGMSETDLVEAHTPLPTVGTLAGSSAPDSRACIAPAFIRPSLPDQLEVILSQADRLDGVFDPMELAEAAQGRPLAAMGFWALNGAGLIAELGINGRVLANFLRAVEDGYKPNPYHNSTHGAHVVQGMHALLCTGGLRQRCADPLGALACYIAAVRVPDLMIHDFGHKGVTNEFLINTRDMLALRYNDHSPHENFHASASFCLLLLPSNNFLAHLPKSDFARLRKMVIELVLGTDMKHHFSITGQFASVLRLANVTAMTHALGVDSSTEATERRKLEHAVSLERSRYRSSESEPSAHAAKQASKPNLAVAPNILPPQQDAEAVMGDSERLISLQMAIKVADLGHVMCHLPVHQKWLDALEEEMFRQGDREKELGLPPSPLCDRDKGRLSQAQVGFFSVVVLPLLESFTSQFPGARPLLDTARVNLQHWQHALGSAVRR